MYPCQVCLYLLALLSFTGFLVVDAMHCNAVFVGLRTTGLLFLIRNQHLTMHICIKYASSLRSYTPMPKFDI